MTLQRFLYNTFGGLLTVAVLCIGIVIYMERKGLKAEDERLRANEVLAASMHMTLLLHEYDNAPQRVAVQWGDRTRHLEQHLAAQDTTTGRRMLLELQSIQVLFAAFTEAKQVEDPSPGQRQRNLRRQRLLLSALTQLASNAEAAARSQTSIATRLQRQQLYLLLMIAAIMPLSTLLVFFTVRRRLQPALQNLIDGVAAIEGGDLDTSLEPLRNDELGDLTRAVDRMRLGLLRQRYQLQVALSSIKQRNEQLSRKSEEVEAFLYAVSHDLRGPLVNLQGFAAELYIGLETLQRLNEELPAGEQHHRLRKGLLDIADAMGFIHSNSQRLERLIDALLELSRLGREQLNPEMVDLDACLTESIETVEPMLREADGEITSEPLGEAYADPLVMHRILVNLLSNAIKYRSPDRRLAISVSRHDEHGMAHIAVSDNGLGIPAAAMPRLFMAFQRYHPERADGEGMGLINSKRLAERSDGTITVSSVEGRGSTFCVAMPTVGQADARVRA